MQDFKTGYITLANPTSMFAAQLIGATLGCFITPAAFWLFWCVATPSAVIVAGIWSPVTLTCQCLVCPRSPQSGAGYLLTLLQRVFQHLCSHVLLSGS